MIHVARKYTRRLHRHQAFLARLEKLIDAEKDFAKKQRLAKAALNYSVFSGHNVWSSPAIERAYREWADGLKADLFETYQPGTCLFVTTQACGVGGLEQLVCRWIESDPSRRYSIAFTRMQVSDEVPPEVLHAVNYSGGNVNYVRKSSLEQTAVELRELASRFETIVLFTYEDDEIPMLAFGSESFRRPVGLYNQCDHHFWINVSIADVVADMRLWGQNISLCHRGVRQSIIVPIVVEAISPCKLTKKEARQKLGFDDRTKVVVSAGRPIKYLPVCGLDFMLLVAPIMRARKDVLLIVVGPEKNNFPFWDKYFREFGDRLRLIGEVPHDVLMEYYTAADLTFDSFPIDGQTTSTDAVFCGSPILSMSQSLDFLIKGGATCADLDVFRQCAIQLIDDECKARDNVNSVRKAIRELMSVDLFKDRREEFLCVLAKKSHEVHEFQSTATNDILSDYLKFTQEIYRYDEALTQGMRLLPRYSLLSIMFFGFRFWKRCCRGLWRRMKSALKTMK